MSKQKRNEAQAMYNSQREEEQEQEQEQEQVQKKSRKKQSFFSKFQKSLASGDLQTLSDTRNAIDNLETYYNSEGIEPQPEGQPKEGEFPVLYYKILRMAKKLARENQEQKEMIFNAMTSEMEVLKLGILAISKRSKRTSASLVEDLKKLKGTLDPERKRILIETLKYRCDLIENALKANKQEAMLKEII